MVGDVIQHRGVCDEPFAMALTVHSIETFGTQDGPGIRLVIFAQGCLMRCLYCHNPDTQPLESESTISLTAAQIVELLSKQASYIKRGGGMTVSGGEPTVQAHELLPIFEAVQASGFHIALDTCGAIFSQRVNQLYDLTDLVILDVKHIDPVKHKLLTRHTNLNALQNAAYREQSGKPMWLRYVLVPGYTDDPKDLENWAKHFAGYKTVKKVEILPYHTLGVHKYQELSRPYPLAAVPAASMEQARAAQTIFNHYLSNVEVA